MTHDETLALYAKGKEAWNTWAEGKLTERKALEDAGKWEDGLDSFGQPVARNEDTRTWMDAAAADFSTPAAKKPFEFEDIVDFSGWKFPGQARFARTKFQHTARFIDATFVGYADFKEAEFIDEARFGRVKFSGTARFEGATFRDTAGFREANFLGRARFGGAKFKGDAWFQKGTFSQKTEFGEATFSGKAGFEGRTFEGDETGFWGTTFEGEAWFVDTTFTGLTWFTLAEFRKYTTFAGACFDKDAQFVGVSGQGFFTLEGATFALVPDFEQARFGEAPRLDFLHIRRTDAMAKPRERTGSPEAREGKEEPWIDWPESSMRVTQGANSSSTARWRALRRLAMQGEDHERELWFFAEELKSLRGSTDWLLPRPWNVFRRDKRVWPGGGRYWLGLFHQIFADFGRSMVRPVLWWAITTSAFATYYFLRHLGAHNPPPLGCLKGQGDPFWAAAYLAAHKGLFFAGLGSSDKLAQAYTCLYGENQSTAWVQQLTPEIPYAVVFAGFGQTLMSTALLFLFLVALRNQFRFK